jgi:hypothetical protein
MWYWAADSFTVAAITRMAGIIMPALAEGMDMSVLVTEPFTDVTRSTSREEP